MTKSNISLLHTLCPYFLASNIKSLTLLWYDQILLAKLQRQVQTPSRTYAAEHGWLANKLMLNGFTLLFCLITSSGALSFCLSRYYIFQIFLVCSFFRWLLYNFSLPFLPSSPVNTITVHIFRWRLLMHDFLSPNPVILISLFRIIEISISIQNCNICLCLSISISMSIYLYHLHLYAFLKQRDKIK